MENFLNRIEICYYNILHTNDLLKKENILNRLITLFRTERLTNDFMNYLYLIDTDAIINLLIINKLDYLLLLTYDLSIISKILNINDTKKLIFDKGCFRIIDNDVQDYPADFNDLNSDNWGDM